MRQKGFAPIIIVLIVALIAIVGLIIYKPEALENLASDLLNEEESISIPDKSLPTTIPSEPSATIPTATPTPTISTPTSIPTVKPTITRSPYPTSSGDWEEGLPDKKDRPYMGG